ncbi:hypothetical protein [Phaeodactylibacter luteus]|uniref:SGNH/GDSL hydrolase family protein n=1 Tax=Phaeodactylibacter luteus TaxID=1564516 RepID=A0A5C6RJ83_9BACT|nr:hypothetical protein [Phaeodactylibacter luteus]TXB61412.1 hypothetical protein FRY97_19155 [Phaeodactylibacter luteus]
MKRFLVKVIVFSLFPLLYFGGNMIINYFIYNNQSVKLNNTSILIVGDSHPQKSINPKYFKDAQNISQTAEPYVLTYWKLKKIFNSYIPDTLIIGFAPHNISQFNDLKFSNDRWSSEMFRRSYPIEEFNDISSSIDIDNNGFRKILWKQTGFYPRKNHINYIGNYSNSSKSNISDWETAIKRHYYQNDIQLGVSQLAVNYLDSIVNLANSKKIELIMASPPVHEHYLGNIPISIMQEYVNLTKKYNASNVVFDKTRDYYPDSLYLNSDHLNEMGAKRFSVELIEYIK